MKTRTKILTNTAVAALLLMSISWSCKDENVGVVGVCPVIQSTNPINLATGVPQNQIVTITFNAEMAPATINPNAFGLQGPAAKLQKTETASETDENSDTFGSQNPRSTQEKTSSSPNKLAADIPGEITYDATTNSMIFTPSGPLPSNTTFTGTVATSVTDLLGNALQVPYIFTFSTGGLPAITATDPLDKATNVAFDKVISATFSQAMDPASIANAFSVMTGTTTVNGEVAYSDLIATFTPTNPLSADTEYEVTITTDAQNMNGVAIAADSVWTFNTGGIPSITSTDPADLATDVALDKVISATFSQAMNPATLTNAFSLMTGTDVVNGSVNYSGLIATFTPTNPLIAGTDYTATISTVATSVEGVALTADYEWTFRTVLVPVPTITLTDPLDSATDVALDKVIGATFNQAMDAATITNAFTVMTGTDVVAGAVNYSGFVATFTPTDDLLSDTEYEVTLSTDAENTSGVALANDSVWTFRTISAVIPTITLTDPLDSATDVALDKEISATFSQAMNPATITNAFTVMTGTDVVVGVVNYAGFVATFTPTNPLSLGSDYTATISTDAQNTNGVALAADYDWTFSTVLAVAPAITLTDPLDLASDVALDKVISATFNQAMDPATITNSFSVMTGTDVVAGAVNYSGFVATFTPTNPLSLGSDYTATISTDAQNTSGVALAADYDWTFSTAVAPMITLTDPLNLATDVFPDKEISATFSQAMNPTTISSAFSVMAGTDVVNGSVNYAGFVATFIPTDDLLSDTEYEVTISTDAENTDGIALERDSVWTFRTALVPMITLTDPLNLATDVSLDKEISATFNQIMDPATLTNAFTVMLGTDVVNGSVDYTGLIATFTPTDLLLSGNDYTVTISTDAQNTAGVAMARDSVWTFSTVAPLGPLAVDLVTVSRFGIIAGVGISNDAGFSEIRDLDVGIIPGSRSSITGFPPAQIINGEIYASDDAAPAGVLAMLQDAKQDLVDAYNFAFNATMPAPAIAPADLGGTTLAPGIYTTATTMLLQNGDLTLDAQGDINAVWIFKVGSSFTSVGTGPFPSPSGGNVILAGGAQAKNVFWVIQASATIGDFTSFKGNILALSDITMNSGAQAEGRMLARNGSVIMTSTNIITKP